MKELEVFFAKAKPKSYKKGRVLIKPFEPINKIFYLITGNVKQFSVNKYGEEVTIHIFKPGSFFPISIFLADVSNRFYFNALSDIKVRILKPKEVAVFLKSNPKVLFDLTIRLSKGLDGIVSRLEKTLTDNVNDRLLSLLSYMGKNFGKKGKTGLIIQVPLTHHELATWLGTTRETITRQMKQLEKQKLISCRKRKITLFNPLVQS